MSYISYLSENINYLKCKTALLMFIVGGKGSSQPDQADDDSGDQEDNQNDQGRGNAQQNGYSRGGRGRGRGFRGYRPRYIRRGGFRSQKPIANQGVS